MQQNRNGNGKDGLYAVPKGPGGFPLDKDLEEEQVEWLEKLQGALQSLFPRYKLKWDGEYFTTLGFANADSSSNEFHLKHSSRFVIDTLADKKATAATPARRKTRVILDMLETETFSRFGKRFVALGRILTAVQVLLLKLRARLYNLQNIVLEANHVITPELANKWKELGFYYTDLPQYRVQVEWLKGIKPVDSLCPNDLISYHQRWQECIQVIRATIPKKSERKKFDEANRVWTEVVAWCRQEQKTRPQPTPPRENLLPDSLRLKLDEAQKQTNEILSRAVNENYQCQETVANALRKFDRNDSAAVDSFVKYPTLQPPDGWRITHRSILNDVLVSQAKKMLLDNCTQPNAKQKIKQLLEKYDNIPVKVCADCHKPKRQRARSPLPLLTRTKFTYDAGQPYTVEAWPAGPASASGGRLANYLNVHACFQNCTRCVTPLVPSINFAGKN
eukprot:g80363.t1